jgi:serine/threonine protein phosphatase PrpC
LLSHAFFTKEGERSNGSIKMNQDNFLTIKKLLLQDGFSIMGVFDGHGVKGRQCSLFVKQ